MSLPSASSTSSATRARDDPADSTAVTRNRGRKRMALKQGNVDLSHTSHPTTLFLIRGAKPQADMHQEDLSRWSRSSFKRLFDCICILCSLPVTLPVLIATAIAVRLASSGPVLFQQIRVGRGGRHFTIFKFRTMPVSSGSDPRPDVTTVANQRFTPIGRFLRRSKLDELPQLFNILRGDMSLVGPRPKLPSHQMDPLSCRPGLTGRATLAFSKEEEALSSLPHATLDAFYRSVVLPVKQTLDAHYMRQATFRSDLSLIFRSLAAKDTGRDIITLLSPGIVGAHPDKPSDPTTALTLEAQSRVDLDGPWTAGLIEGTGRAETLVQHQGSLPE